ncbi:hypothetical protein [Tropicibacter oceani]|uniref:Uncharacterized protein n=1 Tax=Tropicibacter oceani TaxID=3058420 RepID=A0ABY8QHM5_9RHOB|nr:hypothetical protein [Tropicibacter oceani]WGW04147.1 hypothetical protein QF118_00990 [Tropicibacter oceani]
MPYEGITPNATASALSIPQAVLADAPTIQTKGPLIQLADTLDQEAKR